METEKSVITPVITPETGDYAHSGPDTPPESALYAPIILAVCKTGARLFRNHVGVAEQRGQHVRHGLPKGSSDLIGWTADGRFLAIEVKRPGWRPTPAWRKSPQAAFLAAVTRAGGVAFVARSVEEAVRLLGEHERGEHEPQSWADHPDIGEK